MPRHSVTIRPSRLRTSASAVLALMLGTLAAAAAWSQGLKVAPTPPPPPSGELMAPEPLYAAPTRADRSGRIQAAVEVNGKGPYRFILDTGASGCALAPHVAQELGLESANVAQVEVHGATGMALLPAVRVQSLRAGNVILPAANLPVLPGPVLGGADGILGIGGLQKTRIEVDFGKDQVVIAPSTGRRAPYGYLTVPAKLTPKGLLLVKGKVGRIPVQVIIDTGAEKTMGNPPLRTALIELARYDDEYDVSVLGATTDVVAGTRFRAPKITIGEADLVDLPVTFGDLHVFGIWGLEDTPALIVGMDLLGMLERFVVDYRRREFQLKPYDVPGFELNRCVARRCDTRIPSNRR